MNGSLAESFDRLSTGVKILSIITLALLPLGVIALLASLQATRTADLQRRAEVGVAATEASRKLGTELASDIIVLKDATAAMDAIPAPADLCERASARLGARIGPRGKFALFGPGSQPVCATRGFRPARPAVALIEARPSARVVDGELEVILPRSNGSAAVAHYPVETLAYFARPAGFSVPYALWLDTGMDSLLLTDSDVSLTFNRETVTEAVGVVALSLTMSANGAQFGATEALLTFLPLLMWASAAIIGFFVVDRLLIRPLKAVRAAVGAYVPGERFNFTGDRTPAIEIRELGTTFVDFANKLAHREAELAQALDYQVRLTREVHHRVKNNLQVIASLISLHARTAPTPEAAAAYASIQRRVDALAIVHRHHYAGLDEEGGIHLRTLLSELAANLRAGATGAEKAPPISVTAPPLFFGQDSAIPIAFLLTELTELSMKSDSAAPIAVEVVASADKPDTATLTIRSAGLRGEGKNAYARIIEGLARQLRSPLDHDAETGSYAVNFAASAKTEA